MTLKIRKAILEDIPGLNQLIPESVRALSQEFYTRDQIEGAITDIFGVDSQLIRDGTYYVVHAGTALAGCGGWSKRRTLFGGDQMKKDTVDDLLDPGSEAARIRAFFVRPEWARRGIGSKIMRNCEQAARDAGFQQMALVATLPGEPLYRAFGFQVERRNRVKLSNGAELEVVNMFKSLSG